MRIESDFPHDVRCVEHVWVPVRDGCRLAARLWLPSGAEERPVPAILEAVPYRKRDGTRLRDEPIHRWLAGHGYAAVRLDLRGSGDSEGLLRDEYAEEELTDLEDALAWIARRPWCDGAVGMLGKSWGGFNALQTAARRPPELKAVVAVCASDDRYADDVHYMGGALLVENFSWAAVLFTVAALPPDPAVVGARWRAAWLERLENDPSFAESWLRHPRRDAYWRRGSVREDYASIRCPVFAVGGWADAYSNAVPRLLAGLEVPRKGLVGPWAHVYPHDGVPGPAIDFLGEVKAWFDRHLRGEPGPADDDPLYRVWMQAGERPRSFYAARGGRWVAERSWPSERIEPRRWGLAPGRLVPGEPGASGLRGTAGGERLELRSPQSTGLAAGSWCAFGVHGEMPGDQREDDGKSLVFDSAPLSEPLEILGAAEVELELDCDRPAGFVVARLNDVGPDGSSTRVSFGVRNLAHLDGHEAPRPLVPGEPVRVRLRLNDAAHSFEPGHRLRLALSTCYWPIVWPSPEPVRLGVFPGASALRLPVRPPDPADARLRPFDPPRGAPPPPHVDSDAGGVRRTITRDVTTGETTLEIAIDLEGGEPVRTRFEEIDLEHGHGVLERFTIRDGDPLSARAEIRHVAVLRRGSWSVRVETTTVATSDERRFHLELELDAWEGEGHAFSRRWRRSVPREGV